MCALPLPVVHTCCQIGAQLLSVWHMQDWLRGLRQQCACCCLNLRQGCGLLQVMQERPLHEHLEDVQLAARAAAEPALTAAYMQQVSEQLGAATPLEDFLGGLQGVLFPSQPFLTLSA